MPSTVLNGGDLVDVQIANLIDDRAQALDRFAMRPAHDTGGELTGTDIIRMRYPGAEGERWARYWETRFD